MINDIAQIAWSRFLFEKLIVAKVIKELSFLWKLKVHFCAKNDLILDSVLN